ncbi:MAG: 4-alpha-glucanotransferase, partial [Desulfuromonas sp.]
NMPWDLIRVALESPSQRCIIPLPDLLCLGSDARFNRPGTSSGNWSWRLPAGRMTPAVADALAELTTACNR